MTVWKDGRFPTAGSGAALCCCFRFIGKLLKKAKKYLQKAGARKQDIEVKRKTNYIVIITE